MRLTAKQAEAVRLRVTAGTARKPLVLLDASISDLCVVRSFYGDGITIRRRQRIKVELVLPSDIVGQVKP